MATSIGIKMQMEGAAQFKADLQQITQRSKELAAEMKAAASGEADFATRQKILSAQVENAAAKIDKLNQKYSQQEAQLNDTKQKLEEAKRAYGEDSQEAQKLTLAVTKQETALSKTKTEINKATSEMNELKSGTGEASEGMSKFGKNVGTAGNKAGESEGKFAKVAEVMKNVGVVTLEAVAAIGAAAVAMGTAAAAGFIKLTSAVLENYSAYEQLVGGVDKLFGDGSAKVQEYANNAYATAGISANEYMETVTSFSASLINSLGGDTASAADYADRAIKDMSDNANTFGTDMESLQQAYQGFAKGNFTMLDNLKLGYGGTKTEMERLIADANAVKEANGEMADLSIDSFADMTEAIHIMQEQMNIAGTTEREAAQTIEGSVNATKAAWQNFITGLGNSNADVTQLANNLVASATNVVQNVVPIIQNIVKAIPTAVDGIINAIEQNDLLSTVVNSAVSIINGLVRVLPKLISSLAKAITSNLPTILTAIGQALPQLVTAFVQVVEGIAQNFSLIITPLLEALPQVIDAIVSALPAIITAILGALPDIIRGLVAAIPQIIDAILSALPQIILAIIEALPQIVIAIITELPKMAVEIAKAIITNFPQIIAAIAQGLWSILSQIGEWFGGLFSDLAGWLAQIGTDVWNFIKSIPGKIAEGFQGVWEAGKNLVKGLWNGINDAVGWVLDKIKGFGKTILNGIKSIFGIESPSKEMAWIGRMLDEGLAKGISRYSGIALTEAFNVADGISGAMNTLTAPTLTASESGTSGTTNNSVVLNVYGSEGQNVNDLADIVIDKLQRTIIGSEAVYA